MSEKLHAALEFAVRAHAGEDREGKSAPPYVSHPIEVMLGLRYTGIVCDEELMAVALLHDTIEESSVKLSDIRLKFGDRVADLVKELTRYEPTESETTGMSKGEIWQLRSEILLKEIGEMSSDAQVVKLADRLCNVRGARLSKSPKNFNRYLTQTKQILKIIPRERNEGLWDAIQAELG